MKSMIVVSSQLVNKHAGEEYDVIIEVVHEPTTDNIQQCADEVMAGIKDLWAKDAGSADRKIVVHLDAAGPFAAMLLNLQIILKAQAGIVVDLPWDKPPALDELDAESKEVLRKLDQPNR